MQSPITAASVPADKLSALAGWGLWISASLAIVRDALAVKLDAVDRGELDSPRAKFEAALAECDAIEAQTATLVAPPQSLGESFLGYLVADLEAAVAHAECEAKIAALKAHKTRLGALMTVEDA